MIGWGVFGMNAGDTGDAPALAATAAYVVMTLVLHIVYGALNGWLIPLWTGIRQKRWIHSGIQRNGLQGFALGPDPSNDHRFRVADLPQLRDTILGLVRWHAGQ